MNLVRHHAFHPFALWSSLAAIALFPFTAIAADTAKVNAPEQYLAKTTANPDVPKDELEIILTPLRKSQLEVEAEAWIGLLQDKVRELSNAEVAIKRKNRQIAATKQTAKAVEKAEKAAEEAEKAQQEVQAGGIATTTDIDAAAEAEKAAREAEKAKAKAEEAAKAAEEAESETAVDTEIAAAEEAAKKLAEEKKQANAKEAAAEGEGSEPAPAKPSAGEAETPKASEAVKQVAETKAEEKVAVLDLVTKLRDERAGLIDRTRIVLDELKKKGGDISEYENYVDAVSGIRVDVTDSVAVWATAKGWLTSYEGGYRWGFNIAKFLVLAGAFWVLSIIVGKATERALRFSKRRSNLLQEFLSKMSRRVVLAVGVIVALTALEVNIAPLLAVIGAAGFVVGFALQDTLGNFASGIMILLYRPFDVNDVVDVAGVSGTVASLNLVSITIKTFDNKIVIVPNNSVWNGIITNATGSKERRIDLVFGIGYGDDMAKAQAILEEVVANDERILKNPAPVIRVHELGDSSVNFICRPWVKTPDYWPVYWDLVRKVKEEFDANGISIPFPQRDVHVYNAPPVAPTSPPEPDQRSERPAASSEFPDAPEAALSSGNREDE